jgi:hypothetical protein
MDKIKILCLSLWFPLTMSRYFEKALLHRDDVDLKTCGIFTGQWIPWMGGMNLPYKYAIPPDISLPFSPSVGEVNYDMVKAQLGDWNPDIVLNIDAGLHWKYKPSDGLVVHVATDPHALNYDYQRTISDKFFNMQAVYSQKGDIYLPYAYSKYDFYPETEVDLDGVVYHYPETDAVLIGMPYEQRVQWVNELRKRGVSVIFENGPVFDEARALYNRGRIGLNWSSLDDLNCRAFELPAMKLCPIMNHVTDMDIFFGNGVHYLSFTNLNEAIEQVVWAKENPEGAKDFAERAYQNVLPHTYDERVTQILKDCGFVV